MDRLSGIEFPQHGEAVFREDWLKEQTAKSTEIIARDMDSEGVGLVRGGEVSADGNTKIKTAALLGYNLLGQRVEIEQEVSLDLPSVTIPAGESKTYLVVVRHKFIETDFFAPENSIKAVTHKDNSAEVVVCLPSEKQAADLELAEVVQTQSTLTVTDKRAWRRSVRQEQALDSINTVTLEELKQEKLKRQAIENFLLDRFPYVVTKDTMETSYVLFSKTTTVYISVDHSNKKANIRAKNEKGSIRLVYSGGFGGDVVFFTELNGRFLFYGEEQVLFSDNGTQWQTSPMSNKNAKFFKNNKSIVKFTGNFALVSVDGVNFTQLTTNVIVSNTNTYNTFVYVQNCQSSFVGIGNNLAVFSFDNGQTWKSSGVPGIILVYGIDDVYYVNQQTGNKMELKKTTDFVHFETLRYREIGSNGFGFYVPFLNGFFWVSNVGEGVTSSGGYVSSTTFSGLHVLDDRDKLVYQRERNITNWFLLFFSVFMHMDTLHLSFGDEVVSIKKAVLR